MEGAALLPLCPYPDHFLFRVVPKRTQVHVGTKRTSCAAPSASFLHTLVSATLVFARVRFMSNFFLELLAVENFDDLAAVVAEKRSEHLEELKNRARVLASAITDKIYDDLNCAMEKAASHGLTRVRAGVRLTDAEAEALKLLDTPDKRGSKVYIKESIEEKLPKILVRTPCHKTSGVDGYEIQVELEAKTKGIGFWFSWSQAQSRHDSSQQRNTVARPAEAGGAANAKRARKEQSQDSQAKGQDVKQEVKEEV